MNALKQLFARHQLKQDLSEEIQQHLQETVEALQREGLSRLEAEQKARWDFGNIALLEERGRETWDWPAIEFLLADIRHAYRRLRQTPGFTLVCLLTLSLGIGANTGVFTLVNAVLLKSLPIPDPEQLFLVKQSGRSTEKTRFSYPAFQRLQQQSPLTPVAAMSWPTSFYVASGGADEPATGQLVSENFFDVFGTSAALGRYFGDQNGPEAANSSVAVISHAFWQRHFAGNPAVIGHELQVNHMPVTIVGVAAPGFFGARPEARPDFWLPVSLQPYVRYHSHYSSTIAADPAQPWPAQEHINWLQFAVRIRDAEALARFRSVINRFAHQELERMVQLEIDPAQQKALRRLYLTLEPGQKGYATLREQFRQPLFLLLTLAAIILLVSCANVANLLLARTIARERAHAIQLSIGAGRLRLLRQMLIESLLLSLVGSAGAIAVAYWLARVVPKWASATGVAVPLDLSPDWRLLLFGIALAVLTSVLFGLAPALQGTRVNPVLALKANPTNIQGSGFTHRWSLRRSLVVAQVALCLLLLVGAGLFWRTLRNYSDLDPGFNREHLLSVRMDTHLVNYQPSEFLTLYRRLNSKLGAIPGVRSSSVASCALVAGCLDASDVYFADQRTGQRQRLNAQVNAVSNDYFETVGVRVLRGRGFGAGDDLRAPRVALVNQTLAKRLARDLRVLGSRFAYELNSSEQIEIVGVVSDARVNDVRQVAPPLIYFPIEQVPGNLDSIEVRTTADPKSLATQARKAILGVDPRLTVVAIDSMTEQVERNLTQPRLIARLTGMFGLLALGLACLGLYGLMSYIVRRRSSEIGIRLALGSNRTAMLWMVWKETLLLVGIGTLIGLLLAAGAVRLVMGFLYGLSAADPQVLLISVVTMFAAASAATFLPAWKAATANPVDALRSE